MGLDDRLIDAWETSCITCLGVTVGELGGWLGKWLGSEEVLEELGNLPLSAVIVLSITRFTDVW